MASGSLGVEVEWFVGGELSFLHNAGWLYVENVSYRKSPSHSIRFIFVRCASSARSRVGYSSREGWARAPHDAGVPRVLVEQAGSVRRGGRAGAENEEPRCPMTSRPGPPRRDPRVAAGALLAEVHATGSGTVRDDRGFGLLKVHGAPGIASDAESVSDPGGLRSGGARTRGR